MYHPTVTLLDSPWTLGRLLDYVSPGVVELVLTQNEMLLQQSPKDIKYRFGLALTRFQWGSKQTEVPTRELKVEG